MPNSFPAPLKSLTLAELDALLTTLSVDASSASTKVAKQKLFLTVINFDFLQSLPPEKWSATFLRQTITQLVPLLKMSAKYHTDLASSFPTHIPKGPLATTVTHAQRTLILVRNIGFPITAHLSKRPPALAKSILRHEPTTTNPTPSLLRSPHLRPSLLLLPLPQPKRLSNI